MYALSPKAMFSRTPWTGWSAHCIFPVISLLFSARLLATHHLLEKQSNKDLGLSWSTNKGESKEEQRVFVSDRWPPCLLVSFTAKFGVIFHLSVRGLLAIPGTRVLRLVKISLNFSFSLLKNVAFYILLHVF